MWSISTATVRSTSYLLRVPIVTLTAGGRTAAGVGAWLGFSASPSLSGSSSSGSGAGGGGGARLGQWPISAWSKDTGWEKSDSLKSGIVKLSVKGLASFCTVFIQSKEV